MTSANVKALGQGMGTLALVHKAIHIKEQEKLKGRTYNQHWVVFDKDDFPENDFNSAILLAQQNGFEVAYSNQAFEFWFYCILIYTKGVASFQIRKMLSALLGFAYTKKSGVSSKMFNILFSKQEQAINHAKTIMRQFDGNNPAQQESSTTVHLLVKELNKFL